MSHIPTITLRDGLAVPAVGFGTAGIRGAAGVQAMTSALAQGYRLLDTAYNYENEGTVGLAVKRSGLPRADVLVSSKLPGRYHDHAIATIQESLYRAGLDYFDIYLIHWPNPQRDLYVEAWQALIDAQRFGLVRSIGVSNFLPEHLDRLEKETGVLPAINQIELHPLHSQAALRQYDAEHGIITEAWSPLGGQGGRTKPVQALPLIQQLAEKYQKSPAQVILRWEYQLGVLPLPLSRNTGRQAQNLAIFDFALTDAEVAAITALDDNEEQFVDPREHEEL
ncbi:aldo/keto reductase [Schleiferilactobacillus shenzhenensis]|uniref:DkgB n=1 Tax=Schleiferilactobacillus shenzhenensis LY-73 TaxID=1231336 RepID=U4THL0_9LACO|nr:aldo/keto reductase [Schleiferilactobacillus shenzhenensis]ERL64296.1 DkgB [Schleiferilactobacillus shenzhenensis LY-73]